MADSLQPAEFLNAPGVILDVRSPAEFAQAHIPGAISFPLFNNEERARVGTCYKQSGRDQAVQLGLEITGPKLASFAAKAKDLAGDQPLRVHCWRGGMRSASMAWLFETAGSKVNLLEGGYKAFRRWALATLATPKPIITLGGMTGTGKTDILQELAHRGEQVLDLEAFANHRGSSYGSLGLPPQPTTEQFGNELALAWASFDDRQPVWIEAESRRIGTCRVPDELFQQMMRAPVLQVERSRSERVELLVQEYGKADPAQLIEATERLRKRLGGDRTQEAVESIQQGHLAIAVELVLNYYDQTYQYDLERRSVPIYPVNAFGLSPLESAQLLQEKARFYCQDFYCLHSV